MEVTEWRLDHRNGRMVRMQRTQNGGTLSSDPDTSRPACRAETSLAGSRYYQYDNDRAPWIPDPTTPIYTPQGYGSAYTENALQPSLYGVTRTVHPPVTLYRAAAPNERNPTRNEQADDSEDEDAARKASVQEDDPSEGEPEQTVRDETEGEDEPSTARLPLAMEPSEDRLDDGVTRPGLDQRRRVSSGRVKVYVDREGNIYETSSSDRPLRQNDNGSQRSPAAALGADMRRLSISQSENRRAGVTDAEYLEPQLYQRMGPAAISGNPPQTEELDRRYKVRNDPNRFFKIGRVFCLLWHENAGSRGTTFSETKFTRGRYGEDIYTSPRRMIVVREGRAYCWCIPIHTYSYRGVTKDVDAAAHSVIYMDGTQPHQLHTETGIVKRPIAVRPVSLSHKLHRMSRLNFGKVYTVEHNVKVMHVGDVVERDRAAFVGYWGETVKDTSTG